MISSPSGGFQLYEFPMFLWGHVMCYTYTLGTGEKYRAFQEYQRPGCQDASQWSLQSVMFEIIVFL